MSRRTILFVDDDQYEMGAHYDALSKEFEVTFLPDPRQAMEVLRTNRPPDLVISDLKMRVSPDDASDKVKTAGIGFCEAVHRLSAQIPIVVLTVVTEPETVRLVQPYVKEVLNKPIGPKELVRRVRKWLGDE